MSNNQEPENDGASGQRPDGATSGQPGGDANDSIVSDEELSNVTGGGISIRSMSTNMEYSAQPSPTSYTIKP